MALNRNQFRQFITGFQFRELFNEMGWDNDRTKFIARVNDSNYELEAVGKKSGFMVFVCSADNDGHVPDTATRKKIETQVRRLFQEHLIIFRDSGNSLQIWQWVSKPKDRPSKVNETRWKPGQDPEILFQKTAGIYFELQDEGDITIVDVTAKVAANFDQNNERVTRRFYDEFKKHHKAFTEFVSGIDDLLADIDNPKKQWYVSLMLNRLMFCYFIQKKGFLDKNPNYLQDKLRECRQKHGKNKYYSFYRDFLLALFHEGLGNPLHNEELKAEIGRIPYLNGGLFDTHELESQFAEIGIDDEAFENIFEFFGEWNWYLDDTDSGTGRDINPDVIGYIFEKYINERAAMGAYYTKEDITDYISKNCILPFLFDETKRHYPKAFQPNGQIWSDLKASSDTYIYDAVKKGVALSLPANIEIGVDTSGPDLLKRRKEWNRKAPEEYALPTEIWREVMDRRRRYSEAKARIDAGEITEINDFITYNLDIRQFVLDCVQNTEDAKFLENVYKSIAGHVPTEGTNEKQRNPISIIDPTCGSGAFLFAALNILEELYSACIQRMEDFIEDEDRANAEDKANFQNQYSYFRRVLAHIKDESHHPNRQYFIYKSIILNNLYGVDIMKEAVEIAKLRLFLKLVATVDADYRKPNLGLEPLPDLDFNIRAGNTLIGIANQEELDTLFTQNLDFGSSKEVIDERMEIVSRTFARFKSAQITTSDFITVKEVKQELFDRLRELNDELDRLYHEHTSAENFDDWQVAHQPFHWIVEFYEIVHDRRGFDVSIGNPPYVEITPKKVRYRLPVTYSTVQCGNLFAVVSERCTSLVRLNGRFGFIVPSSSCCTPRMAPLMDMFRANHSQRWISLFDERPGKLFDGVDQQLAILIAERGQSSDSLHISPMFHWKTSPDNERPYLFSRVHFTEVKTNTVFADVHPKISGQEELCLLTKIAGVNSIPFVKVIEPGSRAKVYYRNAGGRYWKLVKSFPSYFRSEAGESVSSTELYHSVGNNACKPLVALYASSLFYWYWRTVSNCRHLTNREFSAFPLSTDAFAEPTRQTLSALTDRYEESLKATAMRKTTENARSGTIVQDEYFVSKSKPIIDAIDAVLAKCYGLSEEELDFIINYDIKYRLGSELGEGENEDLR
jgi:hypothetical protein